LLLDTVDASVMIVLASTLLLVATIALIAVVVVAAAFIFICRCRFQRIRKGSKFHLGADDGSASSRVGEKTIAFYHPRCSAGGGGERVLWKIIQCLGEIRESGGCVSVAIYTADPNEGADGTNNGIAVCSADEGQRGGKEESGNEDAVVSDSSYKERVMKHVKDRFGIEVSSKLPIKFVHIDNEWRKLAPKGPVSMIAESIATVKLALAALNKFTPDIYVDTTGAAFTFVAAKILAGCKVAAYVHYPTISTDMLNMVWEQRPSYNNNSKITQSRAKTAVKLVYYSLFAVAYGSIGSLADLVMVNSTWTCNHIKYLWRLAAWRGKIHIVYPPCDTRSLEVLPLDDRERVVLSIGQFRPEKDHTLQIRSFARMLAEHVEVRSGARGAKLVLVGSCRDTEDEGRVARLRDLAKMLGVGRQTEFVLNQPFPVLKSWFGRASVGIHTMWNEHFGIGVVEMMAAGLITVAHESGGPKSDIIVPLDMEGENGELVRRETGYLASTVDEYASAMYEALKSGTSEEKRRILRIRQSGREQAKKFSDEVFADSFKGVIVDSNILR